MARYALVARVGGHIIQRGGAGSRLAALIAASDLARQLRRSVIVADHTGWSAGVSWRGQIVRSEVRT